MNDADFSYNREPAIGGLVWDDVDADGVLEAGESGIAGVTLELHDGSCTPGVDCRTEVTGSEGEYEFLDLVGSADYTVLLDECTLPINSRRLTNQNPFDRSLGPDEVVDDAHVGYQPLTFPFFESFEGTLVHTTSYEDRGATCLPGAAHFGFETASYDDTQPFSCSVGQGFFCLQEGTPGNSDGPSGRLELNLGGSYARSGVASAAMDDSDPNFPGNYTLNHLVFRADLTGYSTADRLLLDFSFIDHNDEEDYGPASTWVNGDHLLADVAGETEIVDVVDVRLASMPAGQWVEIYRFDVNNFDTWVDVRDLDVSQAIETALGSATNYDAGFEMRFRQFGNRPISSDGLTVDDILLYWGTGDSGIGDRVWRDRNDNSTFDAGEGMPCVLVELYGDANGNGILDGNEGNLPLRSLSTDALGQYDFAFLAAGQYIVALDPATLPTGLSVAGSHPRAVTLGGTPLDTVDFELQGGVFLPYTQGFEGAGSEQYNGAQRCLAGLPDVQFETVENPQLTLAQGSGFYHSGQNAATIDSFDSGSAGDPDDVGSVIVELDLSFYDTSQDITLDFWWMHHAGLAEYCSFQDLGVEVRGNDSEPWLALPYDMDLLSSDGSFCSQATVPAGQWEQAQNVDISGTLAGGGQQYSETFQLRFYWAGDLKVQSTTINEGLTIDDIVINGPTGTALGDRIWNDVDGDGSQDPGEPGLPGVTVQLINGSGGVVDTAVTSSAGSYTLSTISIGTFRVVVAPPAGGTQTADPDASLDHETTVEICAPGAGSCTGVPFGTVSAVQDFGYGFAGSIAGSVFQDTNGDQTQQGSEPDFAGVSVTLLQGGATQQTTTTDAAGLWSFSSVGPGTWTVAATPPTGTVATTDPDWPATPGQFDVTLSAGGASSGNLIGFRYNASIAGTVVQDDDADGTRDPGEPGIPGRLVTLIDDATGTTVTSQLTDSDGEFLFQFLLAGTYRVRITPPDGTAPTFNPPGDGVLDNETTVTIAVGQTVTGRDFGYTLPALSGVVFSDTNGNGVKDGGESGMVGVVLSLIGPGCNPCTKTTDGTGAYLFPGLSVANYSIHVDENTLTVSGAPELTTPVSMPFTIALSGLQTTLDIGYDSLALPGIACTSDNAFYYDFEGLSNSFLPTSSSSGPFSGNLSGAAGWSWGVETFLVNGASATNGKVYTGTQALGDNIPGDPRGKSVTLHSAGWGQQWITLTLDLSALDLSDQELLLDFDYADHGEDSNPEDQVQIRGTSSDEWITVHTLHPDKFTNDTWIEVRDKNLLSYLTAHGQTPGATFQLRIGTLSQYMARIGTDLEGLTIDNVCLRTGTLPQSGKLEGFIFKDIDGDGVRENTVEVSEVGFEGVELELFGPDCAPCSLTTDRGGWYRQENLTPGNYTLQITSVPGSPIQTKAGPTPIVIRPGDNIAPERGFLATQVFTENTVMMAKGYAMENAPPAEIWWVDPTTGSTRRATQAQNILNNGGGAATPSSQDEINSLAANVNSCQVYYGNGTKLYRWDVLADQHYYISNLAVDFPSSNCSTYDDPQNDCFTGTYLDSAGATFWPATNTLYLASEGGPVGRFNISAIHEIQRTPDGTDIVSLRRLPVQEDAQSQIGTDDGNYPVGGFGDIVPFDNGSGGVMIVGSTQQRLQPER